MLSDFREGLLGVRLVLVKEEQPTDDFVHVGVRHRLLSDLLELDTASAENFLFHLFSILDALQGCNSFLLLVLQLFQVLLRRGDDVFQLLVIRFQFFCLRVKEFIFQLKIGAVQFGEVCNQAGIQIEDLQVPIVSIMREDRGENSKDVVFALALGWCREIHICVTATARENRRKESQG